MRRAPGLIAAATGLVLALFSSLAGAAAPIGYLDIAGCDFLQGWSQDPDEPAKAIDVHLYFGGPAGSGAPGIATNAGVYRGDLCGAIGSCEHGFAMLSPLSLHDGQARPVHAYGIDSQGGTNPELGVLPMTCAPGAPSGVRRKVEGAGTVEAWRFAAFWDALPLGAAEADAMPVGPSLPAAPELVKGDDGSDAIWLIDGGVRRAVPMAVVANWRLDLGTVETRPAAELGALVEGTALRPRPVVFIRGGLYLIDDPQPEVPQPMAGSSSAGAGGGGGGSSGSGEADGAGGAAGGEDAGGEDAGAGCGCGVPGRSSSGALMVWVFGAAVFLARMRTGAHRPLPALDEPMEPKGTPAL